MSEGRTLGRSQLQGPIPRARMPSLPQDLPAAGLGTGFPMVRDPPSELTDFYLTSYEAAFGKRPTGPPRKLEAGHVLGVEPPGDRSIHPLLGVHTGSGQDTDVSTTSEDFKVLGCPEYQRKLPEHANEPECRCPTGSSFSCLCFREVRAPEASGEYGTPSHCTSPAKPDVPPRATELPGCTGTTQRSDLTAPEQPLDVGDGQMDSVPAKCSTPQPAMGHPAPFALPELQVGPKGITTCKEPLAYSTIRNQHLTDLSPLAPTAPGWWAQTPMTWAPRSVEGVQTPSPSGFSTNNKPTSLWRINDP